MPTTPQDHRTKAETAAEPFTFDHDGETYTLPSTVKAGLLRKVRKLDELDMLFTIIEETADPDAVAAIDDMDTSEFNDVVERWQRHIGVGAGN